MKSYGNPSGAVAAVELKQFNITQYNLSEGGQQKFAILIVDDNSMN
jgi:hypothetical protein